MSDLISIKNKALTSDELDRVAHPSHPGYANRQNELAVVS